MIENWFDLPQFYKFLFYYVFLNYRKFKNLIQKYLI